MGANRLGRPADIPYEAWVLIELANSRPLRIRADLMADAETAVEMFEELGLPVPEEPLLEGRLGQIRQLREAVNAALDRENEEGKVAAWQRVDAIARQMPLRISFSRGPKVALRPQGPDDPLADLLVALHTAVLNGTWDRIRLCANHECAAAFYDTTRSRTQRWHSYATCGNKSNVAAYRARTAKSG